MFYIFHGDDRHTQQKSLGKLKSKLGDASMLALNTMQLEGKSLTLSQLRGACDAMPFLAPKRLIIVDGFFSSKPPAAVVNTILAYLPAMPDSARLVFLEPKKLSARSKVIKLATSEKKGYVKDFSRPSGHLLQRWIRSQVQAQSGRIHPQAVQMLAVNVGNNLTALEQEIEKLTIYRNGAEIRAEDVALLSPYAAEVNIFALVDALGERDGRRAGGLLHQKLADGNDPFRIFAMFIRQFRLLLQMKAGIDEGSHPPQIAKAMNIRPFVATKLQKQAARFSLKQLIQIYRRLLKIDVAVKTGKGDLVTELNLLIAGVTR